MVLVIVIQEIIRYNLMKNILECGALIYYITTYGSKKNNINFYMIMKLFNYVTHWLILVLMMYLTK